MSGAFHPYDGQSDPSYPQPAPQQQSPGEYQQPSAPSHLHAFSNPQFGGLGPPLAAPPLAVPPQLSIDPHLGNFAFDPAPSFAESPQLTSPAEGWLERAVEASPVEPKSAARSRRKQSSGDQVKHRRTRSGCYTCRSRRVKCDEKRPVCERCRKGSRECLYPEPKSERKGSKAKVQRHDSMESVSEEQEESDEDLAESPMGEPSSSASTSKEPEGPTLPSKPRPPRRGSKPGPATTRSSSSLDSPTKPTPPSRTDSSTDVAAGDRPWASLAQDQQFYLDYHRSSLSYCHYSFKHDHGNFVHSTLLEAALQYDPLRYAVLGFAAFHHTVNKPGGKLADFLAYYNKSVSLLRKKLQAGEPHTEAMLMTILQLATFEEYLGDWVNLFGHQRAAYEMLLELYDPESLSATSTGRVIFSWYARFDLFAGLMAGNKTTLDIEWFRASALWYAGAREADPSNFGYQILWLNASNRVMAVEMAALNAKLPKGEISFPDYIHENDMLRHRIATGRNHMDQLLRIDEYYVTALDGPDDLEADAMVGPFAPGQIMCGPLYSLNFLRLDWAGLEVMAKYQSSLILEQPLPQQELFQLAMEQIRLVDRIDRWPGSPPGALISVQASLGLASLFVPKDGPYTMWCRRKLAKIECFGYIYPPALRARIAASWAIPSIQQWWLPDYAASCPPVIRSLRAFIDERTTAPRNQLGADIRAMKAMFRRTSLGDGDSEPSASPASAANTVDSGTSSRSAGAGGGGFGKMSSPGSDSVQDEPSPHGG